MQTDGNEALECGTVEITFRVQNSVKQGYVLSPLFLNFSLKYASRKMQENEAGL
jgi:hypothetical protein